MYTKRHTNMISRQWRIRSGWMKTASAVDLGRSGSVPKDDPQNQTDEGIQKGKLFSLVALSLLPYLSLLLGGQVRSKNFACVEIVTAVTSLTLGRAPQAATWTLQGHFTSPSARAGSRSPYLSLNDMSSRSRCPFDRISRILIHCFTSGEYHI